MGIDNLPGTKVFIQRDVRRTATASVTVAQQLSPIGSIVSWAKTLTGVPALPAGWVQCDGQVLSDADSLLDGTTIPDLNGDNQFMRGNSTSGGTGGSETMAHTHGGGSHSHGLPLTWNGDLNVLSTQTSGTKICDESFTANTTQSTEEAELQSDSSSATTGAASNTENRPPFYNVVWIMRIK